MPTAGRWPPLVDTSPTPGSCEIFCAALVSVMSWISVRGMLGEVTARVRMGASAGLTFA